LWRCECILRVRFHLLLSQHCWKCTSWWVAFSQLPVCKPQFWHVTFEKWLAGRYYLGERRYCAMCFVCAKLFRIPTGTNLRLFQRPYFRWTWVSWFRLVFLPPLVSEENYLKISGIGCFCHPAYDVKTLKETQSIDPANVLASSFHPHHQTSGKGTLLLVCRSPMPVSCYLREITSDGSYVGCRWVKVLCICFICEMHFIIDIHLYLID